MLAKISSVLAIVSTALAKMLSVVEICFYPQVLAKISSVVARISSVLMGNYEYCFYLCW